MEIEVYKAINAVQDDLAKIGIQKDKKNAQQGYNFRGIDDVYGALSPLLAKHKLCIIPNVISRSVVERTTAKGGVLFYVTVESEFAFVSAIDGSKHIAKTFGEAMDSADKATNKAMSAAYKYAAFQTFCIPVDAQDADLTTPPEITPRLIDEKEQSTIIDMINAKEFDKERIDKFLRFIGAESIETIKSADFQKAMAALRSAQKTEKK